ncbi:hypothetical protein B0H11DRAFT_2162383 [Mycena galericulata]|nr:hypothetical protein B0H11DRAFT_2162383 [Mycena galericulata]
MMISNKSTMEEEYIKVPYGREARESGSSTQDDRERSRPRATGHCERVFTGLNGLNARLKGEDDEPEYRSFSTSIASGKAHRDYELPIATIQTQLSTLQRERKRHDADERGRQLEDSEARVRQMEEELDVVRRCAEEQTTAMLALQRELDELRESHQREKEREARRTQEDEDELCILRERCEEEAENGHGGGVDLEAVDQLRDDMEGLLIELGDLSRRNDKLMTAKDLVEAAKTELHSVKGIVSGVLDIHATAFLSTIDSLLTGRSNGPTRVLTPMKSVVNTVSTIVDDVHRPVRERSDVDTGALAALHSATSSRRARRMRQARVCHDAAASHVAATITEIGHTVCVRKASRAEQEQAALSAYTPASATNGFAPSLKYVDEGKTMPQQGPGTGMGYQRESSAALSSNSARSASGRFPERSGNPLSPSSPRPVLEAQTESILYAILSGVRSQTPSPTLNENLTQIITIQRNDILHELSEVQSLPKVTKDSRHSIHFNSIQSRFH